MGSTALLNLEETIGRTKLSRAAIYSLMKQGRFPRPVPLTARRVAWAEAEVTSWIQSRIDSAKGA